MPGDSCRGLCERNSLDAWVEALLCNEDAIEQELAEPGSLDIALKVVSNSKN